MAHRAPVSVMRPANGVLRARLASFVASTVHVAAGSITQRFAGLPSAIDTPPWTPSRPATSAGRQEQSASTSAIGSSSFVRASASAVSRPSMPGGAWSNASSFISGAWGA